MTQYMNVVLKASPPFAYHCDVCKCTLKDGSMLTECDHRFCTLCLAKHFRQNGDPSLCPGNEKYCMVISSQMIPFDGRGLGEAVSTGCHDNLRSPSSGREDNESDLQEPIPQSEAGLDRDTSVEECNNADVVVETRLAVTGTSDTIETHDPGAAAPKSKIFIQNAEDSEGAVPTSLEQDSGHDASKLFSNVQRHTVLGAPSNEGILQWKICNYAQQKKDAVDGRTLSLYSQPFYVSRPGYRICARVYLNGDGKGKGSHLSLYFVVTKGEYDHMLEWPFRQRVVMTLLDQSGGSRHFTDSFYPDPWCEITKQPECNEEKPGCGFPFFFSHKELEAPDSKYLRNDTLYIHMAVDVSTQSDNIVTRPPY